MKNKKLMLIVFMFLLFFMGTSGLTIKIYDKILKEKAHKD